MRLSRTVLLWLAIVPIATAQSLSFSEPIELPARSPYLAGATDIDSASNGRGFMLVSLFMGRYVTTPVSASGEPAPSSLVTTRGTLPALASAGETYLAAWKVDNDVAVGAIAADGSKTSESIVAKSESFFLDAERVRIAANDDRYLLVWTIRADGKKWLRAALADRDGRAVANARTLAEIEDGVTGVARAGSNFVIAYRTASGIETILLSPEGAVLRTSLIVPGAAPLTSLFVVSTRLGPMVLFSPQGGGTYAMLLNNDAAAVEPAEQVVSETVFRAIATDGSPVILARSLDGKRKAFRISFQRLARELAIPRDPTLFAIAWNGRNLLAARAGDYAQVRLFTSDGRALTDAAPYLFIPIDQKPRDAATAGGVDLIAWGEARNKEYGVSGKAGRFRAGVALDGAGFGDIGYEKVASDGTSTFLAAGIPNISAQIIPVEGAPLRPVVLGGGQLLDVVWDGQDFLVFWQDAHVNFDAPCWPVESTLYAARVRRDGTVLTPEGGFVLMPQVGAIRSFQAAQTANGFTIAWHMIAGYRPTTCLEINRAHVAAYTSNFNRISDIELPVEPEKESWVLSIASNGSDRTIVGALTFLSGLRTTFQRRTFVVNGDGEQKFSAKNGPHAAVWTPHGFVMMFSDDLYDVEDEAVVWDGVTPLDDVRLASKPVLVDVKQSVPILAASAERTICVYPVRYFDALHFEVTRILMRTVTVLPKPEATP